jgi:hypothetical protein
MSDQTKISGRVVRVTPEITSGNFTKRELHLAILEDTDYPQTLCFEFGGKSKDAVSGAKENDNVTVFYNLAGREWTDPKTNTIKVFNTLRAWKVQIDSSAPQVNSNPQADENGEPPF